MRDHRYAKCKRFKRDHRCAFVVRGQYQCIHVVAVGRALGRKPVNTQSLPSLQLIGLYLKLCPQWSVAKHIETISVGVCIKYQSCGSQEYIYALDGYQSARKTDTDPVWSDKVAGFCSGCIYCRAVDAIGNGMNGHPWQGAPEFRGQRCGDGNRTALQAHCEPVQFVHDEVGEALACAHWGFRRCHVRCAAN